MPSLKELDKTSQALRIFGKLSRNSKSLSKAPKEVDEEDFKSMAKLTKEIERLKQDLE